MAVGRKGDVVPNMFVLATYFFFQNICAIKMIQTVSMALAQCMSMSLFSKLKIHYRKNCYEIRAWSTQSTCPQNIGFVCIEGDLDNEHPNPNIFIRSFDVD